MIPISLYIHLPWCIRKCPYCDFNSHKQQGNLPEAEYIAQLIHDLKYDLANFNITRPLHSIFFGGGTPSLFSANKLGELLETIHKIWPIENTTEITLEANPGTAEQQKFADYRAIGINRLSLGIQSFNESHLKKLGRIHDANEAVRAFEFAQKAGFSRVNIDLMFGLPQQTVNEGLADLQQAVALAPQHISWYELTLEPNTVFYKKPPILPDADIIETLHEQGQDYLAEHGYQQYEISAYAKPGEACRHNLNYWEFGDYIGIGAGAHGKITTENHIIRTRKHKQPDSYLKTEQPLAEKTIVTDVGFEYFLNAFRLNQSIDLSVASTRTGLTREQLKTQLKPAIEQGFVSISNNIIHKTELGHRFLNDLLILFI